MINQPVRLHQRATASRPRLGTSTGLPQSRTTWAERVLLAATIMILPLQDHFPAVGGMSVMFLIFGTLILYVLVNRPRLLGAICSHPLFVAAYAFIIISLLLEITSPLSRYSEIVRFAQMIVGALSVAVLCRDRSALAAGLYGHILAGLWVAVILCTTSYGALQEIDAEDFAEASKARSEAFSGGPVAANINALAFVCVQGAIVAFALCLSDRWKHLRVHLLGITAFCLIASFLPMSRGAALMSLVSFGAIFYTRGIRHGKALMFACVLGVGVYMLVPNAVWSRMVYSNQVNDDGRMESRARLYTNAVIRLPEYIVAGVGAGNYYGDWGTTHGFNGRDHVMGAHNTFIQIALYWGLFGLLAYLLILWCAYRAIPLQCRRDELAVALVGLLVSLGILLLQTHTYYDKSYALGVGMLVGARYWVWPTGMVPDVVAGNYPSSTEAQMTSVGSAKVD